MLLKINLDLWAFPKKKFPGPPLRDDEEKENQKYFIIFRRNNQSSWS